jgi:hypothetical protein
MKFVSAKKPMRDLLESSLLSREGRGRSGASYSRAVQVLEGNERSVDTRKLGCLGVVGGEGEGDAGVVNNLSCCDVEGDIVDEVSLGRRASARDSDRLSVGTVDSSIAVTSSGGVNTGLETEAGYQAGNAGSVSRGGGGCSSRGCGCSSRGRCGSSSGRGRGSCAGLDGSLLRGEGRRGCGASYSGTVKVLKSNEGSVNASELGCLGAIGGECDRDGRVVRCVACIDVGVEVGSEGGSIRRASARNSDGLSVGTDDGTITVTSSSGVNIRCMSERRDQGCGYITSVVDGDRRDGGDEGDGEEGSGEFHLGN